MNSPTTFLNFFFFRKAFNLKVSISIWGNYIQPIKTFIAALIAISIIAGGTACADSIDNQSLNTSNASANNYSNCSDEWKTIVNVSEEKFCHNSWGQKYITLDGIFYYPNLSCYDAWTSYSGSDGDIYDDVLVVAYTNNTIKVFDSENGVEIKPQNKRLWRFSTGNYRLMEPHYTTMVSGGGKKEPVPEPTPEPLPSMTLKLTGEPIESIDDVSVTAKGTVRLMRIGEVSEDIKNSGIARIHGYYENGVQGMAKPIIQFDTGNAWVTIKRGDKEIAYYTLGPNGERLNLIT